jgi:two-component system phosphate regulon sensor histidine kinase PhoR
MPFAILTYLPFSGGVLMPETDHESIFESAPPHVEDEIEKIILRSMNEGVITLECTGDIYTVNPAALRILGFEEEELKGKKFAEVFLNDLANDEFTDLVVNAVFQGVTVSHAEVRFKRPDGQVLDLSVATSFLQVDECRPGYETVVTVFRDITAFKNLERVRRRAVDHLSHELKTPLSIIDASVEMLARDNRPEAQRQKDLDRIKRNLERLRNIQQLVEEILHPPTFKPRSFDVVATVERIIQDIRGEAAHRSVALTTRQEPLTTDLLDPDLLEIVLRTLVKNAIEHTPDGGEVIVSIQQTGSGILLNVEDHGTGIPIGDQEFVFEGFHHIVETDDYSSKKPYDFNAGGKGLELLRLKTLSEAGYFDISFESSRCRHIPTSRDQCPGNLSECPHEADSEKCKESGGTTFSALFRSR